MRGRISVRSKLTADRRRERNENGETKRSVDGVGENRVYVPLVFFIFYSAYGPAEWSTIELVTSAKRQCAK